ncbi:LAETG motif-containing sortase-dependent surface protein [Streptomyces sp. NRRL S-340]|uniref:LAETG motif-containing sortase-dependent surface protein n=1 Tax=Streptomyces sp. NRRL S-340 TaxID=1463901 RepID=UPI00055F357B|nr:LAETG motif-containing sortase-dependent surface protein [Streptomyces sp. NRRL S-340]
MSTARRTLLTAAAAGTLLGALWFVPSASASGDTPARAVADAVPTAHATERGRAAGTTADRAADGTTATATGSGSGSGDTATAEGTAGAGGAAGSGGTELADTGSVDTTPYVVGGSLFLAAGAGFVVYSVRRERLGF